MSDCSQANDFIVAITYLVAKIEDLLWIYPTIWGIVLVRKIFYA